MSFIKLLQENTAFMQVGKTKVFDTDHAIERMIQRYGKDALEDAKRYFKAVIEYIRKKPKVFESDKKAYLIVKKSEPKMASVIDYRKDRFSNENRRHLFVVTYLPPGQVEIRKGAKPTKKVTIESILEEIVGKFLLNESKEDTVIFEHENMRIVLKDGEIVEHNLEVIEI